MPLNDYFFDIRTAKELLATRLSGMPPLLALGALLDRGFSSKVALTVLAPALRPAPTAAGRPQDEPTVQQQTQAAFEAAFRRKFGG